MKRIKCLFKEFFKLTTIIIQVIRVNKILALTLCDYRMKPKKDWSNMMQIELIKQVAIFFLLIKKKNSMNLKKRRINDCVNIKLQ